MYRSIFFNSIAVCPYKSKEQPASGQWIETSPLYLCIMALLVCRKLSATAGCGTEKQKCWSATAFVCYAFINKTEEEISL
jgi:hypothetical protein